MTARYTYDHSRFYNEVDVIMEQFCTNEFDSLYDPLAHALAELRTVESQLIFLHKYHQLREQDFRSGCETYGYSSVESILGNLFYISDRWRAAYRLNWLLGLINPRYRCPCAGELWH